MNTEPPDDLVAIRHPANPGFVTTVSRVAFPGWAAAGWVEAKSPKAKALVETASQPGDVPNPSPEEAPK